MPAPLQRSKFRCSPDGSKSPQATASMSAGVAAMGGIGSPGKYHAKFPARQRKRLQVGTTNLVKCNSVVEVANLASPGTSELHTSVAFERIGETNVAAMKTSIDQPHCRGSTFGRSSKMESLVLRTENRRLSELSSSNSTRGSEEHCDSIRTPRKKLSASRMTMQDTGKTTELPGLRFGGSNNSAREAMSPGSQSPAIAHSRDELGKKVALVSSEKVLLAHNRAKLYEVFMDKYGSMRAVFRAFNSDANGMISAQRFQDMVEAAEVDLSHDEMRVLYKTADINGDNTVAFEEFVQMFSPSDGTAAAPVVSAYSPVKDPAGPTRDPSSSLALKYRTPLELSPRSRRRMKQLRKQVTDELRKKHGIAIGVRGGKPEHLLAYAFKNVDADNDGYLSYSEVEHALGRGFLKLEDGIPAGEMREMLQLMDRNGDEQISLREFVHYFAVGEREVATNLIDNARKKELAALHAKRTVELTPRDVVDPLFAQRILVILQEVEHEAPDIAKRESPGTCLPEQLCQRTAAIINTEKGTLSPPDKRRMEFSLSSSPSSLQLEMDRRPATSCGTGGPTVRISSPVSPDRFYHRRHERTDWSRVGVGGDGIRSDTGLYLSPQERFTTTTNEVYSPLYRAPPSAKGVDSTESFVMMRAGKPSTTTEEDARRSRRTARYDRTQARLQEYEDAHVKAERLKDWKSRANVRKVANERFSYLDTLQEREHKVTSRDDHMQRRHGGSRFLRMWAGSAESQFNNQQHLGTQ